MSFLIVRCLREPLLITAINSSLILSLFSLSVSMRKLALVSLIGLLCALNTSAQFNYIPRFRTDNHEVLDKAQYVVKYELKSKSLKGQRTYDTSENMLLIGKKVSKFFNPDVLNNPLYFNGNSDGVPNMPSWGLGATEVFQNVGGRQEVVLYSPGSAISAQVYSDQVDIDWQITSETIELLGYPCQKATCRFRGRNYVAWFTTQVPLNNGPWKFSGLPGLILKVRDSQGDYIFTAKQVSRLKEPTQIVKYDLGGYDRVTRQEANALVKRFIENPYSVIKAAAVSTGVQVERVVISSGGTSSRAKPQKRTYVGLKLE